MHNVLIISYIAFSIGNLFILPESKRKPGFSSSSSSSSAAAAGADRALRGLLRGLLRGGRDRPLRGF